MDIEKICAALSSKNRVKIAKALVKKSMSSIEVFKLLGKELDLRREAIYKYLEMLTKAGILEKFYDSQEKKLKYKLIKDKIVISFSSKWSLFNFKFLSELIWINLKLRLISKAGYKD